MATSTTNNSSTAAALPQSEQQQQQQHRSPALLLEPAPPGDDRVLPYACLHHLQRDEAPPAIWHGSSMSLIARATSLLNDEFNEIDPEQDFEKWRQIGARPYFLSVLESESQIMTCCLRFLMDGDWSTTNGNSSSGSSTQSHNQPASNSNATNSSNPNTSTVTTSTTTIYCKRRLIVDYLVTIDECQGRGYASHLLDMAVQFAAAQGANCYALALEESCVYWMSKGFILEQDRPINKRLNVFPDSHLLKLPSNKPEDPADFPVTLDSSSSDDEDDDDNEEDDDGENNNEDSGSQQDEDADIQRAIMMSLGQ